MGKLPTRLHHTAYVTQDLEATRKFYEEMLGFKPGDEIDEGGVVYQFGDGTSCVLYPTPNAGTSRASQAFWQVQDIDAEVNELKKRGVKFETGVLEYPWGYIAVFADPHGNRLQLRQGR